MKIKKFIYVILLVALLLPGCRLEETVELDITLNFPAGYAGPTITPEKLHFAIFNGDAILQQESVKFSAGKVSLTVPMGEDPVLAVLGSEIDASDSQEYAIMAGSVGLSDMDEMGNNENGNKSIVIDFKQLEWASSNYVDSILLFDWDLATITLSWEFLDPPIPGTEFFLTKRDGPEIYRGTDLKYTFSSHPGVQNEFGLYAEFKSFGENLKTKEFFYMIGL